MSSCFFFFFGANAKSREVKYLPNFDPSSMPSSSRRTVPDFSSTLLLLLMLQNAMSDNYSVAGINLAAPVHVLGAGTRRLSSVLQLEKTGSAE